MTRKEKNIIIWVSVGAVALIVAAMWVQHVRENRNSPEEGLAENYLVIDLYGPDEWLATHNKTAVWKGKTYSLPMGFKIAESAPAGESKLVYFETAKDGRKLLTVAGNPVDIAASSLSELGPLIKDSAYIENVGGRSASVAIMVLGPRGTDASGYERPSSDELRKLLTSSGTYPITTRDWIAQKPAATTTTETQPDLEELPLE